MYSSKYFIAIPMKIPAYFRYWQAYPKIHLRNKRNNKYKIGKRTYWEDSLSPDLRHYILHVNNKEIDTDQ